MGVLVRLKVPYPVFDVAAFHGVMPDGERRWILADIRLNNSLITHWSYIDFPEDEEDK